METKVRLKSFTSNECVVDVQVLKVEDDEIIVNFLSERLFEKHSQQESRLGEYGLSTPLTSGFEYYNNCN